MSCAVVLFPASCAAVRTTPAAIKRQQLDPNEAIIEIPPDLCPELAGSYAISQEGLREMLRVDIEKEAACNKRIGVAETNEEIANSRAEAAIKAANNADWWSRWGLAIGVGIGLIIGGTAGGVAGGLAGKALK
jgi:hypothetical protein